MNRWRRRTLPPVTFSSSEASYGSGMPYSGGRSRCVKCCSRIFAGLTCQLPSQVKSSASRMTIDVVVRSSWTRARGTRIVKARLAPIRQTTPIVAAQRSEKCSLCGNADSTLCSALIRSTSAVGVSPTMALQPASLARRSISRVMSRRSVVGSVARPTVTVERS